MRLSSLLILTGIVACGGAESAAPIAHRGLRIVSGADVTDTVWARLPRPLVVEVHDSSGAPAPLGTVVNFESVGTGQPTLPEVTVQGAGSSTSGPLALGTTDALGRAQVIVRLGIIAGTGRVVISVPALKLADTARYTITAGAPVRIVVGPADTLLYPGGSFSIRGGVTDQFDNVRNDPVTWTVSDPGVSVSSAGTLTGLALGRYTATATGHIGSSTVGGSVSLSVAPRGRLAVWQVPDLAKAYDPRVNPSATSIAIMDLDGANARTLVTVADGGVGVHPAWMPDGRSIVYTALIDNHEVIQTVDTSGAVRPFFPAGLPNVTSQIDPAPTADGQWLYFSAYDSGCGIKVYCLYRSRIDGSAPERLGTPAMSRPNGLRPAPSPDGSRVAFVVGGDESFTPTASLVIKVFDVATGTVSSWGVSGLNPAWSPDGTQIAFPGPGAVSLVKPDGTGLRVFVPPPNRGYYYQVSWSPDSRYIFVRTTNLVEPFVSGEIDMIDVRDGSVIPIPYAQFMAAISVK